MITSMITLEVITVTKSVSDVVNDAIICLGATKENALILGLSEISSFAKIKEITKEHVIYTYSIDRTKGEDSDL